MKIEVFCSGKRKLSEKFGIPEERVEILIKYVREVFEQIAPPGAMVVFESSQLLCKVAEPAENIQELVWLTHIATLALIDQGIRLS